MTGRGSAFTLHVATTTADLDRLGRTMHNCLATYGRGRLRGRDRIVEVREDGATRYAIHLRDGRIVTFEAARNRGPDPRDVPVIRDLLDREGHLRATLPRRRRTQPRTPPAGSRARRPAPTSSRQRIGSDGSGQPELRHPAEPPHVSVQALAADLLRPPRLGGTEWPEFAAALWAVGRLPSLPDPSAATFARVIHDIAERIATGEASDLPHLPPPTPEQRRAAIRELQAGGPADTTLAWQRRRAAEVLAVEVRP